MADLDGTGVVVGVFVCVGCGLHDTFAICLSNVPLKDGSLPQIYPEAQCDSIASQPPPPSEYHS